jgi:hypothetical protein
VAKRPLPREGGSRALKRTERYTLVSDRPWPAGEARTCSLDSKWKEGHCFPPNKLDVPKYKYLVDATLDESIRFDKDGWAGLDGSIVCRLFCPNNNIPR